MKPTSPRTRIFELDALRGIAVFGMILWDFRSVSMGNFHVGGEADRVIDEVMRLTDIENTTHLVFSFLFGWGLSAQALSGKAERACPVVPLRRLGALFVIGAANLVFVIRSDFIHIYALLGFVLLLFTSLRTTTVLALAVITVALPGIGALVAARYLTYESYYGHAIFDSLKASHILSSTYRELVHLRAHEFVREYVHPSPYVRNLDIFAMFLFGLYAARERLFDRLRADRTLVRTLLWGFLAAHVVGLGALLAMRLPEIVTVLARAYAIMALSLFYICLGLYVLRADSMSTLCRPIANVGRMAISSYLLHCLLGTTMFYGYGLALHGKLGLASGEALAVLACAFHAVLCTWWMRRFQFGPVEWLWRSITYFRLQPLRLSAS